MKTFLRILLLCSLPLLSACRLSNDLHLEIYPDDDLRVNQSNWLIMVYMDADNNLDQMALQDLNEMEQVDLSDGSITLLVLADRYSLHESPVENWSETRLYRIDYDEENLETIQSLQIEASLGNYRVPSELDMGDPDVLDQFIEYGLSQYPSAHQALILWNHGRGWRGSGSGSRSLCEDESSGNLLYTSELGQALENHHLDIIGMDLCYGSMAEVLYEIQDSCHYLVASSDEEPAAGWDYSTLLQTLVSGSAQVEGFCQAMVDSYRNSYSNQNFPSILSVLDSSKMPLIMESLDTFCQSLSAKITCPEDQLKIQQLIEQQADGTRSIPGDMNIDIYSLGMLFRDSEDYSLQAASNLMEAMEEAVVYHWKSDYHSHSRGLTLHYSYVDSLGNARGPIENAYFKGYQGDFPLKFVENSLWTANSSQKTGLLYDIWFKEF